MRNLTINQMWLAFKTSVIRPDCSQLQLKEMEKCFHAGVFMMLTQLMQISQPECSETAGILYLEELNKEMRRYLKRLSGVKKEDAKPEN